ncbi:MAG: tyrosine-type recombinase/integrase [Acidimicrobiales bacterium]
MRVARLVAPGDGRRSWTVVDDDGMPVEPVESYLGYLTAIERSPNTVRAYATSLRFWFEFCARRGVAWDRAGVGDVARFVADLRAPADNVIVLDSSASVRSPATVNRHLGALFGFYDYQARSGVALADGLATWRQMGRGSYKPFLHHVTKGRAVRSRPISLRVPRQLPATLTAEQIGKLVAACEHLRDRLLLAVLAETGMRIGQALGLRHADIVSPAKEIRIVPRADNANDARAKCRSTHTVPVTASLIRLYSEYLFSEYGELDCDYVFVNLWGRPLGHPLRYQAVSGLVARLAARTGIDFHLHLFRHSHATDLIRQGVPIEIVSRRLTHASVVTTSQIYLHLSAADVAAGLVRAGVWPAAEARP